MVEIECLACDKTLKLPQSIDMDNYDGQLVCSKCKALLHVKLVKGKLRKYKIVERVRPKNIKPTIIVQDEATKANLLRIGERTRKIENTGKPLEGEGIQGRKII
jgi:hypothetical protein